MVDGKQACGFSCVLCVIIVCVVINTYKINIFDLQYINPVDGGCTIGTSRMKTVTSHGYYFNFERLCQEFKTVSCPVRNRTMMPSMQKQKTGLLSFPASGNSWIRNLIEQLSGFYTCDWYTRDLLLGGKIEVPCIDTKSLVYKSHGWNKAELNYFNKTVILIRDPRYVIKSFFNFKFGEFPNGTRGKSMTAKHHSYVNASEFYSSKWKVHVKKSLSVWERDNIFWMKKFKDNGLFVLYEDFKENVASELLRLARFIGIEFNRKDFWCTLVNQDGADHRIPRNETETSVSKIFTVKQNQLVIKAICAVSNYAQDLGIKLDISRYLDELVDKPELACLSSQSIH